MMLKKLLTLSLIFFCSSYLLTAQQRSFSTELHVFIDELYNHVAKNGQEEVVKEADKFKQAWTQNLLDDNEKKAIRDICEDMLLKKLTVSPYFELFITTINFYLANGIDKSVLTQWQQINTKLLASNVRQYLAFLETAKMLFAENILYVRDNQKWYADNNKFELIYDGRVAIKFGYLTLSAEAFIDKMQIFDTEGVFYPDKAEWIGKNGRVFWSRVGTPQEEASCKLTNYRIDFKSGGYTADSAYLRYPKYFAGDVLGQLSDKISFTTSHEQLQNASYPAFVSYKGNVKIDKIVGDLAVYEGGFSLLGKGITGDNIHSDPVTITLLFKKKPQVILQSSAFKIQDQVVVSLRTNVTILVDSGRNITHPSVEIRYDFGKRELRINKGSEGLMQMAFQDDYHNVEIDVDRIIWKQDLPYIEFDNVSKDKSAFIESGDYYKEFRYEKVQGVLQYNPLFRVRDYSIKTRQRKFSVNDYAAYYKSKPDNLKPQLIDLADDGFIIYDNKTDSIEPRPRLFNYVNNHLKLRDYDVIRMSSVIAAKPNVSLNLNSLDLSVEGVPKFIISDSQNCIAVPNEQRLLIKKDRDMVFGGVVRAGKVDFYSKEFNFKYNPFMITNTHFDSMVLYYPDETSRALRKVQSVLSDLYGTLEFDYPKNKSGLKKQDYPDYPIFTSERGSKVHYEYANTHNFIYKKESFYFEVDPFRITNLNNFTAADLKLPGTFISADIFPDFRYELTIQPDYSLGFVKQVSLPMYKNKGKGDMTLSLSNLGLYGSGTINYLGSVSKSESFLMLPNETKANTETFDLPEQGKYPLVAGREVGLHWLPYKDKMLLKNNADAFEVFKMKYAFNGTLTLAPKALSGNGKLQWDEAEFLSENMVYGTNKVDADTSSIRIYSVNPEVFAFNADNMQSHIDFTKRTGDFKANTENHMTYMPLNKYGTTLSEFKWKMDPKRMEMKPNPKFASTKPLFLSTHKDQDSLSFESSFADFDLNEYVIYIEKIPHIDIADSRVFPNKGKATVRTEANMDKLDSAAILANKLDKFHDIKHAGVKIFGKNNIRAAGEYTYLTKLGEQHTIQMDSIKIDRDKHLVGVGYITDSQSFYLDVKIQYKGYAKIVSTEKPITYFGYIKPDLNFDFVRQHWIKFKGPMDAQDVLIDVADARNSDDRKMLSGLFVAPDSVHIYPMLFGMKSRYSDAEVTLDSGVLYYDHKTGDVVVGSPEKLFQKEEKGNVIRFNDKKGTIQTEGHYDLSLNVKKGFKAGFGGRSNWKTTDTTYQFNWSFFMDFPLPKEAVERMSQMAQNPDFGKPASVKTQAFVENLTAFYPTLQDAKSTMDRVQNAGVLNSESVVATSGFFQTLGDVKDKVQEVFDANLYIREVANRKPEKAQFVVANSNWYFDNKNNAFVCNGAIDIASMNGVNVNKTFGAIVVVDKKRSGDDVHIYIEFSPNDYVYFNYVRGVMYVWSTDEKLNTTILEKGEKISNDEFSLRRGTPRSIDKLLRRFD